MTARVLRERYVRAFMSMDKYSTPMAWALVTAHVVQFLGAALLGAWLLGGGVTPLEGVAVVLLMIFIGTRFRALNNIVHECTHASFAEVRGQNTWIGKVCSALTLGSFLAYRHEHLSHHAHLGDYEHDLDLQGIEKLGLHDPLSARVVLRHAVTPLIFRHLPYYLSIDLSQTDGRAFQLLKLGLLGSVTALTVIFPLSTALFVILPYVAIYTALNYWADCLDHAGLVPTDDDLDGSRNVLAPKVVSWFLFPRNDSFHLVHHLFPNVPARHLPKAHDMLLADPVYRSAPNAVRGPVPAPAEELAEY